jgi:hypothetical protein
MSFRFLCSLGIVFGALWSGLPSAQAAAAIRTISKVPYTITVPGSYVLGRNLDYAGGPYAITIASDDVTLDLRGFRLRSTGDISKNTQTAGIYATTRRNVVIKNGIVQGFFRGIYLESNDLTVGGQLVENVRAMQSTFLGIQVKGRGAIVRNCEVNTVEGSVVYDLIRYGIDVQGALVVIMNNEVHDVSPGTGLNGLTAYGIRAQTVDGAVISGNRVANAVNFAVSGAAIGVIDGAGVVIERNVVSRYGIGITFTNLTNSIYRDNTAAFCLVKYGVGVDDGSGNR